MPATPTTLDEVTSKAKQRATVDARGTALLKGTTRLPCPGPSKPIACRDKWAALRPLIEALLNSKAAQLTFLSDKRRNGKIHQFSVDFTRESGDISRRWFVVEPLVDLPTDDSRPPRVRYFDSDIDDSREQPSTTRAKLDELREHALNHARLFIEIVGEASPVWFAENRDDLMAADGWIRTWKPDPLAAPVVIAPEEKENVDQRTATVDVTIEIEEEIRKRFGLSGTCLMPTLKVNFRLGQPERDGQGEEVLALPELEEVDAIARELKSIVALALAPPRIAIVGHTDRLGGTQGNQSLSLRRAQWLRDHLTGIDLRAAAVVGCGEDGAPAAPEASPEFRFAEVIVEPAGGR